MSVNHSVTKIGPFRLDRGTDRLLKDGAEIKLPAQAIRVFKVLLDQRDDLITSDVLIKQAWGENTNLAPGTVRENIRQLRKALGKYGTCIENQHNRGYRFNSFTLTKLEEEERASTSAALEKSRACPDFELRTDMQECLSRQNLALHVIDEYIELGCDVHGWNKKEVVFRPIGIYQPSSSFARLMQKYSAKPPIREYYSLQDVESRPTDDERKLIVYAEGSDWRHIFALNEVTKNIQMDDECRVFRAECEKDLTPGVDSKLYRHVNCESLVVSSDNYVILGRRPITNRSGHPVPFSPGAWTASLEEQMLRNDPKGKVPPDADLFACAERGVKEELKVPVESAATRLLSYGIEWGNFTAAFLFLVRTPANLRTVMKVWATAIDRIEAIALDGLPADVTSIQSALSRIEWSPSPLAKTWTGHDAIAAGNWHPTARARLCVYLRHLEHIQLFGDN